LFSDLERSTALYEAIGDASAYALVVSNFDFMEKRVRRHGGSRSGFCGLGQRPLSS
jgi:class 3 adenylate cyclase